MWTDLLLVVLLVGVGITYWLLQRSDRVLGTDPTVVMARDGANKGLTGRFYYRYVRQAGVRPATFVLFYWVAKFLGLVGLPSLYLEVAGDGRANWLVVALAVVGFFLVDLALMARRQSRRAEVQRSLSYFLDLIVAFLFAGLSLDEAFQRAGRFGFPKNHPLGAEVVLVASEIEGGRDRATAFQALADRTGVHDLQKVAAAMRMGLKLGAPIHQTLEAQADHLRSKRREDGLKRINRAVISAIFPVVMCGLPIFGVLVFFPAVIQVLEVLGYVGDTVR